MPDNNNEEEMFNEMLNAFKRPAWLPAVTHPVKGAVSATTYVLEATNSGGTDRPIKAFHQPPTPRDGNTFTILSVIVVDSVSHETLGAATIDVPHEVSGLSLWDLPSPGRESAWAMIEATGMSICAQLALENASRNMASELSGIDPNNDEKLGEWMKVNLNADHLTKDDVDNPDIGMAKLCRMWRAHKEGKTMFQATTYGATVAHVTSAGWDAYLDWLGADRDSVDAQLDRLPEYVKVTFGVVPQ